VGVDATEDVARDCHFDGDNENDMDGLDGFEIEGGLQTLY